MVNDAIEKERFYGKDAECPREWKEWMHKSGVIPSSLLPDNEDNLLLNLPKSVSEHGRSSQRSI